MIKVIKWTFGSDETKIYSTDIALTNNILLSKGQYQGLQFSISGLGLRKFEREIFDSKFLQFKNILNIYIGKLIISYNRKGIYNQLKNVEITNDISLKDYLKNIIKNRSK